ncbi:MAG: ATP-dependent DNA helicase [Acidimicrobiaceae bacterium]|nr:ATP-dependent DNA helicase [Acidimicrobiaceae bacterium]MCY4279489.1 ATP-dependent DNA helicase [Acidimicrobiaceae bacterium]
MSASQVAVETLVEVVSAMPGGGEERAGQFEMCEAVASALDEGRHLVVAAGTGVGKSMAYLAPLAANGKKAVVATATKALQDQLMNKDLPFLAEALGVPLKFAVLKGRSNYVCRKKLADIAGETGGGGLQQQLIAAESAAEAARVREEITKLVAWSDTTGDGDRAGLGFEPSVRAWEAVSVSGRECPGAANCPAGSECFAEQARDRAAESDVLVVNHHLYCLHVFTDADILPSHDAAVFDEAHTLEDIAAGAAGVSITGGRFRHAARAVRAAVRRSETASGLEEAGLILREALASHCGTLLASPPDDLVEAVAVCRGRLDASSTEVREAEGDETRRAMARRLIAALAEDLARVSDPDNEDAVWVEESKGNPIWRSAAVDVGPMLRELLWAHTPAVLTSATVPFNLADRLGLPDDAHDSLDVGSPFDYRSCGLLYCAKHLPSPKQPGWKQAVQQEISRMAAAAGGRTLALFTSYGAMRNAADAVRESTGLRIYCQGDLPNRELISRFAAEEESCLFATMTMWQGVDVPGRSLSLVVMDRIPFPRPDEPLLVARRNRLGAHAFGRIDAPRAATLLAQGAGRLIRSARDRGVVAVLDSRLATARYRHDLLRGLPPLRRTIDPGEVDEFLTGIRLSAEAPHPQPAKH